jgi:selenocysteine-specific elongation factor
LNHPVRARAAYVAYIGSREFPTSLTVLGRGEIEAGSTAMVRLRIDQAVPLLPGNRYVLRKSGRTTAVEPWSHLGPEVVE